MSFANDILRKTEEELVNAVVGRAAPQFVKQTYALSLQTYTEELRGVLEPAQRYCDEHPEAQQELVDTVADALLRAIVEDLKPLSRVDRAMRQDEYLMFVVTFFSPALLKMEYPVGNALCEAFRLSWRTVWPKQDYQIATEEMISAGFDKKWYKCYITQATCEFLGKPDDCFELTAFRSFRDSYLRNCTDGIALIEEYYKSAPAIVQRIAFRRNKDEIYQRIWEEYLQGCLDDLLHSRWEDCKERYSTMVYTLQQEFLPNGSAPSENVQSS